MHGGEATRRAAMRGTQAHERRRVPQDLWPEAESPDGTGWIATVQRVRPNYVRFLCDGEATNIQMKRQDFEARCIAEPTPTPLHLTDDLWLYIAAQCSWDAWLVLDATCRGLLLLLRPNWGWRRALVADTLAPDVWCADSDKHHVLVGGALYNPRKHKLERQGHMTLLSGSDTLHFVIAEPAYSVAVVSGSRGVRVACTTETSLLLFEHGQTAPTRTIRSVGQMGSVVAWMTYSHVLFQDILGHTPELLSTRITSDGQGPLLTEPVIVSVDIADIEPIGVIDALAVRRGATSAEMVWSTRSGAVGTTTWIGTHGMTVDSRTLRRETYTRFAVPSGRGRGAVAMSAQVVAATQTSRKGVDVWREGVFLVSVTLPTYATSLLLTEENFLLTAQGSRGHIDVWHIKDGVRPLGRVHTAQAGSVTALLRKTTGAIVAGGLGSGLVEEWSMLPGSLYAANG